MTSWLIASARVLLVCIAPLQVWANGGTFSTSAVQRTGNLVPMQKELILLDREEVAIRIEEDDAIVQVSYDLINNGPADTVTFGFPVDVAMPNTLPTPNGYEYVMSRSLRAFEVKDGNQTIPVDRTIDSPLASAERPRNIARDLQLVRRWSMMSLKFDAGERKQVRVGYRVRCFATDHGFEGDVDWKFGPRTFFYTFRPAGTWGDGRVRELTVRVDTSWLQDRDVPLTNAQLSGRSSDRSLRELTWKLRDVDVAKLDDLTCTYDPKAFYLQRLGEPTLLGADNTNVLEVSSALPPDRSARYSKESMLDRNPRTAWVEGAQGHGLGETIVFKPKDASLHALGILNGYVATEALYYANSRIKRLRVETDFGEGAEPDRKKQVGEVTLPDRRYTDINLRYPLASADG